MLITFLSHVKKDAGKNYEIDVEYLLAKKSHELDARPFPRLNADKRNSTTMDMASWGGDV